MSEKPLSQRIREEAKYSAYTPAQKEWLNKRGDETESLEQECDIDAVEIERLNGRVKSLKWERDQFNERARKAESKNSLLQGELDGAVSTYRKLESTESALRGAQELIDKLTDLCNRCECCKFNENKELKDRLAKTQETVQAFCEFCERCPESKIPISMNEPIDTGCWCFKVKEALRGDEKRG